MIGRSFLISWSRRWTKGPANMSISTANEVCITIIVNTSIVVVSSFIFSVTVSIYTSQDRSVTWNDRFRLSLILRGVSWSSNFWKPSPPCTLTLWEYWSTPWSIKKTQRSRRKEHSRNPTSATSIHIPIHKQSHTGEKAIPDTVLESKHI